ncbi:MAG TPA: tyrosine--tRNA ligase [Candidatus Saccharimonadales bacterium]|nr:tyrosine--tRNA ligase [Candidatus Saccharimonadales bacterium]
MKSLSEELKWRGFYNQTTLKDPSEVDKNKFTFYFGVDPSSDSMTIGNLSTVMMIKHFIRAGHKPVLLVGGATGLIGDPDGKSEERQLIGQDQLKKNVQAITGQFDKIFEGEKYEIVDNIDWFKDIKFIDFLRDVGKHVPMRQMLGRDFVQSRLGEDGSGISYAEFSYSLMQGYDFLHLYRTKKATLQLCGSDQWGNSIAGVELIRRVDGGEAHVWTSPLVLNKTTGQKFGKTENGAIWLDPKKTSVFDFYQFWLNVEDDSAEEYLKIYTLLDKTDIEEILDKFSKDKGSRTAQKKLAYEVTKIVHGKAQADSSVKVTGILFEGSDYSGLTSSEIELLKGAFGSVKGRAGDSLVDVLTGVRLASSKGEARRLLEQNAIKLNGKPVGADYSLNNSDKIAQNSAVLKKGKNNFAVIDL